MRIMARRMMSAAAPWMGALMAARSPNWRSAPDLEWMAGMCMRRPKTVVTIQYCRTPAPKEISGLSGGLFNMFGNISGIVTPIAIGYIVGTTGSFNGALIYVGVHALIAVLSYLVLVGDIKRIELKPVAGQLS